VLVVGGSSGIGNGIARGFHEHGADVQIWGTRPNAGDYEKAEGSDLDGLAYAQVDVSDRSAIASAPSPSRHLHVLVLSQGTVQYQRQEFSPEGWREVVAVNLDSLMACALRFHEMLATSKGSIIIVSSVGGFKGSLANPAYAASKAGAISLTGSLALAWARDGIRVNGIAPGLVDTKLTKATVDHPKRLEESLKRIPAGRTGTPAEMAGAALFLASPLASYVHGHTLVVDGGMMIA
jgi:3-oxoacyl-[acyl-carrier protein] reductase